jgi:hypothetical protein
LRRLLQPHGATSAARAALGGQFAAPPAGAAHALTVRQVTLLRAHPGHRWTLCFAGTRDGAAFACVGKLYTRERGDVALLLAWLRAAGFGEASALRVPAPLAYLPRRRLLLLEQVPGATARAALRRGDLTAAERAAAWLARLRTLAPAPGTGTRPRDPLARARRWAALVGSDAPALGTAALALAAALAGAEPPATEPRLLHGDFGPSHVLLTSDATYVIDWDAWRTGDPTEDAGRFIASLRHMALREPGETEALAAAVTVFTDAYLRLTRESAARVRFYTAWGCLRRARRLARRAKPGDTERAATLLEIGQAALRER